MGFQDIRLNRYQGNLLMTVEALTEMLTLENAQRISVAHQALHPGNLPVAAEAPTEEETMQNASHAPAWPVFPTPPLQERVREYWVGGTAFLASSHRPLKVWGKNGNKLYQGQGFPLFLFQDGSVETSQTCPSDKPGLVATIQFHRGIPFIQAETTDPDNQVFVCLEDISSQLPLQDGMALRLADIKEGPEFQVTLKGEELQMTHGCETWSCTKDFEVGRGHTKTPGLERLHVQNKYISSKGHGAFRCREGKWYLVQHPARAEGDEKRMHSTWLTLSCRKAYMLPGGARDSKIAVWTIGREAKALFGIETGGCPLTEPEVTCQNPTNAAHFH